MQPLVKEIFYQDPAAIFSVFKDQVGSIFLDSSNNSQEWGRYSFIAVDPWLMLREKYQDDKPLPLDLLEKHLQSYHLDTIPDLPPFQGGVVGYLSYELARSLENLPTAPEDDLNFPDLMMGFYDVVVAFDHHQQRGWIFSSGFPTEDLSYAHQRLIWMSEIINTLNPSKNNSVFDVGNLYNPFDQYTYPSQVQKVIDYIYVGDIYQANLTRRYEASYQGDPFALYARLRERNPAPFSAYIKDQHHVIASASPERFLKLTDQHVETKPIKGTIHRDLVDPVQDQHLAQQLAASEKDRAENLMIVDLMRNDLSRVCQPGSVQVPKLLEVESYATVHHLVTTVTGTLDDNKSAIDLLKATFPGGSITGAPKIRAMEIIAELEPTYRGVYCGSIGYIGFDGTMDTSIVIRTFLLTDDKLTFQVGGGIVADSDPIAEYEETLTKAGGLKKALNL
ncbi:aminodeoxychorismate synthase component I [Candidatus Odyssella acanthamoebae]|uniref:aminodeoxychorismate synthase n=1 Tax=Candidatus Odyssella acanthamoebae TaxID=91604 RepID=A0A077AYK6_9PROT|nr:aminodeoxychorismate synthase component I [Candidatus Paracaedibacter acanthamoebae]AIK96708.1 hypothetical protein ID47_08220 [Candidatus Paracaedibacter acanthamoebae]